MKSRSEQCNITILQGLEWAHQTPDNTRLKRLCQQQNDLSMDEGAMWSHLDSLILWLLPQARESALSRQRRHLPKGQGTRRVVRVPTTGPLTPAHHLLAASEPSKNAFTARQCVVLMPGFGRALHTTMNAHTTIPNRQLYASKYAIRNMGFRITQPNTAANNTFAPVESLLPSLFDSLVSRETP